MNPYESKSGEPPGRQGPVAPQLTATSTASERIRVEQRPINERSVPVLRRDFGWATQAPSTILLARGESTVKVLIIDDDPDIVDAVSLIFNARWPDAVSLSAFDGTTGIEMAKSKSPDVVILDLILPDMDGLIVCHEIRRFFRCAHRDPLNQGY